MRTISDSDEYNEELRKRERQYERAEERLKHEKYADHTMFKDVYMKYNDNLRLYSPIYIEYYRILAETGNAFLLQYEDGTQSWVPKRFILINFRQKKIRTAKSLAEKWGLGRFI